MKTRHLGTTAVNVGMQLAIYAGMGATAMTGDTTWFLAVIGVMALVVAVFVSKPPEFWQ